MGNVPLSGKILIVENDLDRRVAIRRVLDQAAPSSFDLEFAFGGEVARIPFAYQEFAAAVVDFGGGEADARDALRTIRSARPEMEIIALGKEEEDAAPVIAWDGLETLPGALLRAVERGRLAEDGRKIREDMERRHRELRDITDTLARQSVHLLRLRNELAAEKSKLECLINGMADGMIHFDGQGAAGVVNPVARAIIPPELAGGALTLETFHEKFNLTPLENSGEGWRVFEGALDARVFRVRLTQVFDAEGSGAGTLALITDITREKELERMKHDFTSMISHELRTPLTSIRAAADNLRRGVLGPVNERQRTFIELIARNVDRQQTLIDDLLDLAKLEAGQLTPELERVDLALLIRQAVEQYSLAFRDKGVSLSMETGADAAPVKADPNLVTQVLGNLLSNALKFTDQGAR